MKINMVSKDFSVWEIEGFDLPEVSFDNGDHYDQGAGDPELRNSVNIIGDSSNFFATWKKYTDELEEKVKKDSANNILLRQMWMDELEKFKWADTGTVRLLKDFSGFNMYYHVDNRLILGVLLINLIDNVDSTEFENGYVAPKKKGTGIFMLNNNDYHKINVTTDRLVGYQTLSVKDCLK
ncbi:hypothetical protein N9H34_00045 [bacterium]|nr:hypothetical protein [bacterium]